MKIIVGAGITGLWLANEFRALGIPFIVLESKKIGSGQTLASQGIIHGGTKYSLDGKFSLATKEISDMPKIWRDRKSGNHNIKLPSDVFERDHQYIWTNGYLTSKITSFFASKLMNSRFKN